MSSRAVAWGKLLLCLCSLFSGAACSVILQTGNFSLEVPSIPAQFGQPIPAGGISGLLLVADPEDACDTLKLPPQGSAPWIALIVRSQHVAEGCTFDIKVAHAEAAGAVAAIVYDDVQEPLILMSKDPRHPDPDISATFITQRSGQLLKRLMVEGKTVVTITPLSEALWLSMLMSAMAGFLAVNVVLGALWVIRRQRGVTGGNAAGYGPLSHRQTMTAADISALPVIVYEEPPAFEEAVMPGLAGDDGAASSDTGGITGGAQARQPGSPSRPGTESGSDCGRRGGSTTGQCAICLEAYIAGDKLRILPCQHRYHASCVDVWLSSRHPSCPVCKADAHASTQHAARDDVEAGSGGVVGEPLFSQAGLLARMGGMWWAVRRRRQPTREEQGAAEQQEQLLLPGSRTPPTQLGAVGSVPVAPGSPSEITPAGVALSSAGTNSLRDHQLAETGGEETGQSTA